MFLKSSFVTVWVFCLCFAGCSQTSRNNGDEPYLYKDLLLDIRTEKISPQEAEARFKKIVKSYHDQYPPYESDTASLAMVFPLLGKNYKAVGGAGKGFYARQFNLFDHTIAKSHPAQDIFIYDVNKDCKEDGTEKYIDVLAVRDGIVIAVETDWEHSQDYKGGNYVWIYDTATGGLWYYAHQRKVYVVKGQKVKAGDKIAEVGRTGFNAATNRSDTHLHLMYLSIDDTFYPKPLNTYQWLKEATTHYTTQLPEDYPRKEIDASFLPRIPYIQRMFE